MSDANFTIRIELHQGERGGSGMYGDQCSTPACTNLPIFKAVCNGRLENKSSRSERVCCSDFGCVVNAASMARADGASKLGVA